MLVFNNIHLLRNNDEGIDLIRQIQSRAESWASSKIATLVFTSDDFWVYRELKKLGSRMQIISITDLSEPDAKRMFADMFQKRHPKVLPLSEDEIDYVYDIAGGRTSILNLISRQTDVKTAADNLLDREIKWIESEVGT